MAGSSQHSPENSGAAAARGGAGQVIVELRRASRLGLVFWSRQRFETGAELQVRLRSEGLPEALRAAAGDGGWVNLRGFVALCRPERRNDGSFGFQVSLLLAGSIGTHCASAGHVWPPEREANKAAFRCYAWLGGRRIGLN